MADYRIVVGIDGSDGSYLALDWALREAELRGASVRLVHGWAFVASTMDPTGAALAECERAGEEILGEAVARVKASHPKISVTSELRSTSPSEALIEASHDADLVVVGTRGRGGFVGLLLGSVSHQVVHHAVCAVAVIPSPKQ